MGFVSFSYDMVGFQDSKQINHLRWLAAGSLVFWCINKPASSSSSVTLSSSITPSSSVTPSSEKVVLIIHPEGKKALFKDPGWNPILMNMIENGYTVVAAGAFKTCLRLASSEKLTLFNVKEDKSIDFIKEVYDRKKERAFGNMQRGIFDVINCRKIVAK